MDIETSYPYEDKDDKCRFEKRDIGDTDIGFVDIPEGDEQKLKKAVATVGPVFFGHWRVIRVITVILSRRIWRGIQSVSEMPERDR